MITLEHETNLEASTWVRVDAEEEFVVHVSEEGLVLVFGSGKPAKGGVPGSRVVVELSPDGARRLARLLTSKRVRREQAIAASGSS